MIYEKTDDQRDYTSHTISHNGGSMKKSWKNGDKVILREGDPEPEVRPVINLDSRPPVQK